MVGAYPPYLCGVYAAYSLREALTAALMLGWTSLTASARPMRPSNTGVRDP